MGSSISVPSRLVDSPCTSSAFMDLETSARPCMDLDVIDSDASYDNCLVPDPLEPPFNQTNNNLIEEAQEDLACQGTYNQEYFHDEDAQLGGEHLDYGDATSNVATPPYEPTEDDPDPFLVNQHPLVPSNVNISDIPGHLLVIYTMVCWLHMQFHLPRIACNAVLAILACLVEALNPLLPLPFITLSSVTRTLAVDPSIQLLPVCPNCRDVFPSAASQHMQDACTSCNIPLFLPNHTNRGILRNMKTPIIKYPYLPLSQQLISVLKIPGVEALLDSWRTKARKSGEYGDIFDGNMCRERLKAPDGTIFFSNLPHEKQGPGGELRIGVNLGVDWHVVLSSLFVPTNFAVGSLTYAVTLPLHTPRAQHRFQFAISHPNIGEYHLHDKSYSHSII